MNKKYLELLSGVLLLVSCETIKNAPTFSDIDGEWNIVEVNGLTLAANPERQQPFPQSKGAAIHDAVPAG